MDKKGPESKSPARKAEAKKPVYLIDWKSAADQIEAELKTMGWNSEKQRQRPTFIYSLVLRLIIGPLITAIHKQKESKV
jgi:hypothetical protein